jgi:hypothetical protein
VVGTFYYQRDLPPTTVGHYGRVSGTVCRRSDGTQLYLGLTRYWDPTSFFPHVSFDSINVDLPTFSYSLMETQDTSSFSNSTGQAAYCSGLSIP